MGTPSLPRGFNRSAVLSALISARELDRPRLVSATGLSQATVFRVVEDLVDEGLVLEGDPRERSGPGRTATRLHLNARQAIVAGVDLGGTNCRIVLADALGGTLGRRHLMTPSELSGPELADWLAGHIFDLAVRHGGGVELGAVAVGLPGAVAGDKERVVGSVNLPQIIGTDFIDGLVEATGVPTSFDNDSNLALLGELQYGSGTLGETVALLVLGTGLSAAISIDGRVLSGRDGELGEFGRLPLPDSPHRVRDLVSGAGLVAYAREQGTPVSSAREIFADPRRHRATVDRVHATLQHLLSVVALAYEPQSILVTGGLSDSFDDTLLARLGAQVEASVGVRASVRRSSLDDSAGLLGAMSLALSSLYLELGVNRDDVTTITSDGDHILHVFETYAPARDTRLAAAG
ncbi:hypothetical protein GCM10009840_15740 [Pseudolysinimonas kribbensis]|jgi:predicted NBD/HSP70 family sugar kinase|uniref:ROK family transcriptional regulator n=1 Tax=Pseudolysinimonas kribbensis TaxID=433641 RepID=A0ABQ6K0D1_9MICO|nr:ROK family protein [Pseudolysinimonas kribbensis]GMA94077.1 hypothetical protein GCM10025881_09010 [Pseudolysinimonas kribbensis]